MKLFDIKNKVIFTLLVLGVTFNILWSMRLESRADKLGTIVDQYHDRLMKLEDSFPVSLDYFSRTVGSSYIGINPDSAHMISDDIFFKTKKGESLLNLNSTESSLKFDKSGKAMGLVQLDEDGSHFGSRHGNTENFVDSDNEGLSLKSDQMIRMQLDEKKRIALKKNGIVLSFDETQAILDSQRFTIYGGLSGAGFYMDMKKGLIEAQQEVSVVRVGRGTHGEGVELGEFDTGTFAITKGKGIGLRAKRSNPVRIGGENDLKVAFDGNIEINAKGNINIRSENGKIKINGQEIHLNEGTN